MVSTGYLYERDIYVIVRNIEEGAMEALDETLDQ